MNERIRDIAEHCDFYVGNEHYDKSHEEKQRLFMEKFAELIVGECILTIQMGITRDGPDTEKYLRSMKHIRQIEEHFGVK